MGTVWNTIHGIRGPARYSDGLEKTATESAQIAALMRQTHYLHYVLLCISARHYGYYASLCVIMCHYMSLCVIMEWIIMRHYASL